MRPIFRWVEGCLSPDECKQIIEECTPDLESGGFANEEKRVFKSLTRKCNVSWVSEGSPLDPLMFRPIDIFFQETKEHYNIPLSRVEAIQFTDYPLLGHYKRHSDSGEGDVATRIISASVQLSDPSEYSGGDLKMYFGRKGLKSPKGLGMMTIFPSIVQHKVTPLYRGRRRSLVMWGHM